MSMEAFVRDARMLKSCCFDTSAKSARRVRVILRSRANARRFFARMARVSCVSTHGDGKKCEPARGPIEWTHERVRFQDHKGDAGDHDSDSRMGV
jgi:hypothetical protein